MQKIEVRCWLAGLGIFVLLIVSGLLIHADTQFNILDHQAAGSANKVNEIQQEWSEGGVFSAVLASMFGDLIFIGVYSYGAVRAGISMRAHQSAIIKAIGLLTVGAGVVFCLTDYAETIAQIIQMYRGTGSDALAGFAATMQPIKSASFVISVLAITLGIVTARYSSHRLD